MNAKHVHLIGIGGIGLSAIARVLLSRGIRVSGSDTAVSQITESLAREGARIFEGHNAENIDAGVDLVVMTSALEGFNPEVEAARERGIRVINRREFLSELTEGYRTIAIAGSHGKTTTTALIGLMLADAKLDPVVIVGGIVPEFGSNARTGRGDYFVVEADEYGFAFLGLHPSVAVLTNVDYDHPDLFASPVEYRQAFEGFLNRLESDGRVIVCGDDEGASSITETSGKPAITYGFDESNDFQAVGSHSNSTGGSDFRVSKRGQEQGVVSTRIPGRHNVVNAIGAIAASDAVGVPIGSAIQTLARFQGVGRRFQLRGEWKGVALVDDYAHHPSEIRATLEAARERFGKREVWAVFQPHTFSRTRALLDEFARAFDSADHVIITQVYAAREHDSLGVSGGDIVGRMKHRDALFVPTLDETASYLVRHLVPGNVLVTLGAGDVNRLIERLAAM